MRSDRVGLGACSQSEKKTEEHFEDAKKKKVLKNHLDENRFMSQCERDLTLQQVTFFWTFCQCP